MDIILKVIMLIIVAAKPTSSSSSESDSAEQINQPITTLTNKQASAIITTSVASTPPKASLTTAATTTPTMKQTNKVPSASTTIVKRSTLVSRNKHLINEPMSTGSSDHTERLLKNLQEAIQIPLNATNSEIVKLLEDYGKIAVTDLFSTPPNEQPQQKNPAEVTEDVDKVLSVLVSILPPGETLRITTDIVAAEARNMIPKGSLSTTEVFTVEKGSADKTSLTASLDVPIDFSDGINGTVGVTMVHVAHSSAGSSSVNLSSQANSGAGGENSLYADEGNVHGYLALASGIISCTVTLDGNQVSVDPTFTLDYHDEVAGSVNGFRTEKSTLCAFWVANISTWSTEGCSRVSQMDGQVTCYCTHTTSYAVLLQVTDYPIPQQHSEIMTYLTKIGCTLSVLSLAISVMVFMAFETLRSEERYIIHTNFAMALLTSQLVFLLGIDQTQSEILCKILAMCIHYFFLSVFLWMLVEGLNLFLNIVLVFNMGKSKLRLYLFLGWGLPLIIVGTCAAIAFNEYATQNSCWMKSGSYLIWAFAGPAAVIILLNTLLLGVTGRILYRSAKFANNGSNEEVKAVGAAFKGTLMLTPVLGITWVFGFLAIGEETLAFQYIFVLVNSLQGVFFFIFFCFLNKEVRVIWQRVTEKMKLSKDLFSIRVGPSEASELTNSTSPPEPLK